MHVHSYFDKNIAEISVTNLYIAWTRPIWSKKSLLKIHFIKHLLTGENMETLLLPSF